MPGRGNSPSRPPSISPANAAVCDRGFLHIVLHNLFDNAVCYANAGGRILVTLTCHDDHAAIEITNTGNILTAEETTHVLERFWRKESARSDTGVHAGLGLSLCQRLMTLQGGDIRIETRGDVFLATIVLKAAPVAQTPPLTAPSRPASLPVPPSPR